MTHEYIDRFKLLDDLNEVKLYELSGRFEKIIRDQPVADVIEVKHGEWCVIEYEYLSCSVCGNSMYTGCNSTKEAEQLKTHWKPFCPHCGAKMDAEKKPKKRRSK